MCPGDELEYKNQQINSSEQSEVEAEQSDLISIYQVEDETEDTKSLQSRWVKGEKECNGVWQSGDGR